MDSEEGVDHFGFSSWCKSGYYEVDYGWGKPVWVISIGYSESVFLNLIILMDMRSGDGIGHGSTGSGSEDMIVRGLRPESVDNGQGNRTVSH